MSEDVSKRRLGRGLAALIGEMDQPVPVGETRQTINPDRTIRIEFVARSPKNPRRYFDEAELQDLAGSIRQHGIVQPVVVRTIGPDRYEIIAGERRWRAAQLAGLVEIPVIVRDVDDRADDRPAAKDQEVLQDGKELRKIGHGGRIARRKREAKHAGMSENIPARPNFQGD